MESIKDFNEVIFDPSVCVKCGYCKSTCPTYLATRDERFSPRGRLIISYKILKENLDIKETLDFYRDLDTCSKCTECERTCPLELKPYLTFVRTKNKTLFGKVETLMAKITTSSKIFFSLSFKIISRMRKAKPPEDNEFSGKFQEKFTDVSENSEKILFFPSCFGYTIFRATAKKTEMLLKKLGVNFMTSPKSFSCCSAPILFSGDINSFKKRTKKFVSKLKKDTGGAELKKILVNGPTCTWIIKNFMKDELEKEFGHEVEVKEVSDFILNKIVDKLKDVKLSDGDEIILHKPCHSESSMGEKLRKLGFEVKETDFYCCGFGGSMFFKNWSMSDELLRKTLGNFEQDIKNGVKIFSNSPGCILQLSRSANSNHILSLISQYLNKIELR
jgi:Fe-S oxidoreductase